MATDEITEIHFDGKFYTKNADGEWIHREDMNYFDKYHPNCEVKTEVEMQKKAIEQLERISSNLASIGEKEDYTDIAIQALEQMHALEDVLDKIRAEIRQTASRYTISRERGAMGNVEWSDILIKESEVLAIIDKYKAESEDEE